MSVAAPLLRAARRGKRRVDRLLGRRGPDLVYSRRYQLDLPGGVIDPLRGERILSFLDAAGLLSDRALHVASPASFRHLRRVHADEYLDALQRPDALTSILGLTVSDEQAERILEAQRTMVGGTLLATALALGSKGVAVNLGGGLHHAFAAKGERFCAFNDTAVAILELRARGFTGRVLVIDLDLHDGDGTQSIFADDPTVHTFSVHNLSTPDERGRSAVAATSIELPGEVTDAVYLGTLRQRLPEVCLAVRPELVFYLAGCDPAADDQIGNWKISPEALLERDLFVTGLVRSSGGTGQRKPPLVVLLAGGYGRNAWRYGARYLSALLRHGRPLELPDFEESTLLRYRRVARELSPQELSGDGPSDDWGLTAEDLMPMAAGLRPTRFLGFYTRQGLELVLERSGVLDRLRNRGFAEPTVEMELGNPAGDTVRLYGDPAQRELLIEVRVRVDRREMQGMALLRIEWLLLQNPRAAFLPDRPRLPGQQHPGMGLLPDMMALLVLACDRLQLDGVLFVPAHFHTASQGRKILRFVHPEDEGFIRALERAFAGMPLAAASHAVAGQRVVDARTGEALRWHPMPMVVPVSEQLREKLGDEEYRKAIEEAAAGYEFRLLPPGAGG
ncbi:MAG TPA: histone deacetylase [Thermoanaerobaculia bacterium]|nr:histone deacetylase [Thermoanaerobaculia bacterium]